MADSKLATTGTTSPPPNCAICLGSCTNRCKSDSCVHEFCFSCLLEWSKIKPECPLCKQTFRSIIHNIKSNDEYDEHIVENIRVEEIDPTFVYLPPVTTPPPHQYHFRTTLTVDTRGEHAIQQMLLSHPLITIGTFPPERYPHHRRRRNGDTSTAFRRSIYAQNLWVISPPDITGRYRDVTPSHYRRDPAARARLVPWLNRELNALLYENTQQVMQLVDIIMDHLLRHHICSRVFRTLLYDYLGNKTDHFIHEFYSYMRSPFDMIGYDRHAIYTERPAAILTSSVDLSDDYDSDVIIVNSTTTTTTNNNNNNQQSPIIIDLIDTDSDEPIIVSEETPVVNNNNNNNDNNTINDNNNDSIIVNNNNNSHSSSRKPILPLKIRIKSKRKSKEKKPRHHSKRRRKHIRSPSSSSSSSTSSSTLSSSSGSSSVYEYKKRTRSKNKCHRKLKSTRTDNKKYKKKYKIINNDNKCSTSSSNSSCSSRSSSDEEDEDNIPLAKMIRKHKTKYKPKKLAKEQYFDYDQNIIDRLNYSLPSNEISQTSSNLLSRNSSDSFNSTKSISIDGGDKDLVNSTYDNDDYYDIKPNVKSEIKVMYHNGDDNSNSNTNNDELDNNASGPSTSGNGIRDFIDENHRLWYYRPHSYDQDSSSDN